MEPPTRERILQFLKKNRSATVTELSRSLGVTRADIRYNLKPLLDTNIVIGVDGGTTQIAGRGRPAKAFMLAPEERPSNLLALLKIVLENNYSQALDDDNLNQFMDELASALVTISPGDISSITARLNVIIRTLNEQGYQSHWEAHASGPRIEFHNCPYFAILGQFPWLCEVDRKYLAHMSGRDIAIEKTIQADGPGTGVCRFVLSESQR